MCSLHNSVRSVCVVSDHSSAPYSIYVEKGEKRDKVVSESFSLRSNSEFSVTPRNLTPGPDTNPKSVGSSDCNMPWTKTTPTEEDFSSLQSDIRLMEIAEDPAEFRNFLPGHLQENQPLYSTMFHNLVDIL